MNTTNTLWVIIGIIFLWLPIIYTVFYKRNELNKNVPLIIIVLNYFNALSPLGLLFGLYLENREKRINGIKGYKYSEKIRMNGRLIWLTSIVPICITLYHISIES